MKLTARLELAEGSPFGSKRLTLRRLPLMRSELPDQHCALVNQILMALLNSRLRKRNMWRVCNVWVDECWVLDVFLVKYLEP